MHKKNKTKAIIIIPARGGSKRIKNKNLIKIGNLSLIEKTIIHALNSAFKEHVYISTDCNKIKYVCEKYPIKVIKRPAKLANDFSSSEDALLHVLENINEVPEYVIFLQCTSPFREKKDIDRAFKKIILDKSDSLLSVTDFKKFIWFKQKNKQCEAINYDIQNRKREQDFMNYYQENGSIFISKTDRLKKYRNRLSGKISMYIMNPLYAIQIDEPYDLEYAKYIQMKLSD